MAFRQDRDRVDREILDIIPERYDADPDSHYARKTAHTRLILTIALALLSVAAVGVAARHIFFPAKQAMQADSGVPLIKADDKPIKTKPAPEDRGGMEVPNRDKLVYERMGTADAEPGSERLLPPPEAPASPPAQPRSPSIKPAFQTPPAKEINTANLPPEPAKPAKPAPTSTVNQPVPPAAAPVVPPAPAPVAKAAPTAPAAPAKPAAAAPAAAPAKASAGGGWHVQLASLKTEAEAKAEWSRIHGANKDVLGSLTGDVVRTDLGAKGIYWRIYAGPVDEAQARTVCAQLSKRNQGCIIGKK